MLYSSNPRRRFAGKLLIVTGLATALPTTATWATQYIDVPAAPIAPVAHRVPATPLAPPTPAALVVPAAVPASPRPPQPPAAPLVPDLGYITNDTIQMHGRTLRWDQLTRQERRQVRVEIDKAKVQLGRDRSHLDRDMAGAREEVEKFRNGDFERQMTKARIDMAGALRELDANAVEIRRAGQDPEALKAQVRASLREVQSMDIAKITREALVSVNPERIKADLEQAEGSLDRATARLDQLDRN